MSHKLLYIEIEHEDPVALPLVLANRVRISLMNSASDPAPRRFELRAEGDSNVILVEIDPSRYAMPDDEELYGADAVQIQRDRMTEDHP